MAAKHIDLNQSVHALCAQYPELIPLLAGMGFPDITQPGMLASAGRFMTIPRGAALKKLDIHTIIRRLADEGFSVSQ